MNTKQDVNDNDIKLFETMKFNKTEKLTVESRNQPNINSARQQIVSNSLPNNFQGFMKIQNITANFQLNNRDEDDQVNYNSPNSNILAEGGQIMQPIPYTYNS